MTRALVQWCLVVFFFAVIDVQAHDVAPPSRDRLSHAPRQPAPGAADENVSGSVHRLIVDDQVAGVTITEYSARLDDGRAVALHGNIDAALDTGDRVHVTGRSNGSALFVSAMSVSRAAGTTPAQRRALRGKLALLHADYFDDDRGEFILAVEDELGDAIPLALPRIPESLHRGMRVTVSGTVASDGVGFVPDQITIESLGSDIGKASAAGGMVTDKVLVILMRFNDSPANPFTQAQVQTVFAGGPGSGSVAQFFNEASFGLQTLAPTVTTWLATNVATPANCNYFQMGNLGRTAATNAGYPVSSYQKLVYVFPRVASCGWAGLAYVGASGAWINGFNTAKVYGHELGHNFGLLHAASLRCSGVAIGGTCTASEYGDPFDMMGNQRAMHFNAPQKLDLGWIPAGSVATHATGQTSYVLNPLELAGGSLYALKVPVATNRTYWLEYRQPIGFDSLLSAYPSNGAQVRIASPFETLCGGCTASSNDTQLLDMTPATSAFTDATLVVGQRYTDATYGVTFDVLGATPTGLTVRVTRGTTPGPAPTTTMLVSAANPSTTGSMVTFTASVTGTAPTGTVAFADNGATISGCGTVALSGTGNSRTAKCTTSAIAIGTHAISSRYAGDASNAASSSAVLSQVVVASTAPSTVWVEDNVPTGTAHVGGVDGWKWVSSNPAPFSGSRAHQSALASGIHQHYFTGATATMTVAAGDTLYAYVYLDPANPPSEVMLQWNDGTWDHRAYWGANLIGWGANGTVSRRYMGPLPAAGQWVRLAVPASAVGLEGRVVNGMAFALYNGRATWDRAGKF